MPIVGQGGTISLRAETRNGSGQLSDPTSLVLEIRNPSNAVAAGPFVVPPIVRDSLGMYHYSWAVPALATLGDWLAVWTGVINSAPIYGQEPIEVVLAGSVVIGPVDQIIYAPGDYDSIRAMLGVTDVDIEDTIIDLPAYRPYMEERVKAIVPDWEAIGLDPTGAAFLRAAVRYGVAALLAESYVKGGTVSLVHEELPRRNWSEWARIFWLRYEEAIARVTTSGVPDDDFDAPMLVLRGPSRAYGARPDWAGEYPPVWPVSNP